jgi:hypothetical protein
MKEYKIVTPRTGFSKRVEKLEEILNNYAREGWVLKHSDPNMIRFILEREKNR